MSALASTRAERSGAVCTVYIEGEIDLSNVETLRAELEGIASNEDLASLVLDLTNLTFMDSQGIHMLVLLSQRMGAERGFSVVVSEESSPAAVLRLSEMAHRFPIEMRA